MQEQQRTFNDKELLVLFNSNADLSLLSDEEKRRLITLTDPPTGNPADSPSVMNERSLVDRAVDHLPAIGGAIGGFVAKTPVAGTAVAGALGAGGEAVRQMIRASQGRPQEIGTSPADAMSRVAEAGAVNAAQEAGGRLIVGGLRRIAPAFMKNALGAQSQVEKDFSDVNLPAVALRERVIPGSKASLRKVTERGAQHAATVRNNLRVEDLRSGNAPVVTHADAVSELRKRVPDARMAARGGAHDEIEAVKGGLRNVSEIRKRPLNAEESYVAKQAHQKTATAAYRAKPGAEGEYGAEVSDDIARGMGNKLKTQFPQHAADMQRAQEMIALERALFNAAPRTALLRNSLAGASGAGAGAAMYGATGDIGTSLLAGAAVPATVGAMTAPGALARYGIAADMAQQAMQGPAARVPDTLIRQQLLQLLMGSPEEK